MKTITFFFATFLCTGKLDAQDIITKADSSKVVASIAEITPTQVKYKLFNYEDGPLITSNRSEIAYITFKNGMTERFPKTVIVNPAYNPNRYNLDKQPVSAYNPEQRIKKCAALYKGKNYIGFNYITFLNTALGFNYMRDIKKANLIINVPFAVGLGAPSVTNGLYGRSYLDNNASTKYDRMQYQIGLSTLFAPGMSKEVNFLMGPSFNFTSYIVSVNRSFSVPTGQSNSNFTRIDFKNTFELRRLHYGVNVGFLARFSERFNMNMLLTIGYKKDSYTRNDPYGVEQINKQTNGMGNYVLPENVMPYVNFAWSLGYRF
jgi:hypothetical protein